MMRAFVSFLLVCVPWAVSAEIRLIDDLDREVVLERPAQRVIALSPHLTENLFSAGGGDRLVATVRHANFPSEVADLPKLGDALQLDWERLLALKPDLILHWGSGGGVGTLNKLEKLGLTVYVSELREIDAIPEEIQKLAQLMGTETQIDPAVFGFSKQLQVLRDRYATAADLAVFYALWDKPLMTIGNQQIIHQALNLCGARNVFADLKALAPIVSLESLIGRQPELIVAAAHPEDRTKRLAHWRNWNALKAIREQRWMFLEPDALVRPSLRLLDGVRALCVGLDGWRVPAAE